MRRTAIIALGASVMLAGCGKAGDDQPAKRQPGSWTSTIQILKLEGPKFPAGAREQMQAMFDSFSKMSVCLTPEAAARDDIAQNLERTAGQGKCTFDKKDLSGSTIEFAGTCTGERGEKVRLTAKGSNSPTSQDITVNAQSTDASGKTAETMEMRISSKRNGDCTDKDIRPPEPAEPKKAS